MSTITTTRKRVKPARFIRFEKAPNGKGGLVIITVGKLSTRYRLTPFASDFGRAFFLEKLDGPESYHVNLDGIQSCCDCPGFLRHGHCKHVDGLHALVNAERI